MVKIHSDDISVQFCTQCRKFLDNEMNCGEFQLGQWNQHVIIDTNLTDALNILLCNEKKQKVIKHDK